MGLQKNALKRADCHWEFTEKRLPRRYREMTQWGGTLREVSGEKAGNAQRPRKAKRPLPAKAVRR